MWSKLRGELSPFLFYRENLEWLARATNWAKFTATASLGVIHKVNVIICSRHFNSLSVSLCLTFLLVCFRFLFVCFVLDFCLFPNDFLSFRFLSLLDFCAVCLHFYFWSRFLSLFSSIDNIQNHVTGDDFVLFSSSSEFFSDCGSITPCIKPI